jgi:hypothetical protein
MIATNGFMISPGKIWPLQPVPGGPRGYFTWCLSLKCRRIVKSIFDPRPESS